MAEIVLPNKFTPRWYQQELMDYLDNGGKRAVEVWSRRAGKDICMAHQAAKAAHVRTGMYLHLLPTLKQARKVLWDALDNDGNRIIDTAFPKVLRESTNESDMKIKFKCGSLWQLVGADYFDSLVGSNPVGLTMSEAAITDPSAWNYLRPILAGNGGWATFITTPRGNNWIKRLLQTAKKDAKWHWSHLTAKETGHIGDEILLSERREMPDEMYRQEYEVDFSAANVGAIFGKWMEAVEKSDRNTDNIAPIEPDDELIMSSDIGRRDKAAWWWWRPVRGGLELVHFDQASGLDAEEWIDRLAEQPRVKTLYLPHDARAKTFQTRHSVVEQFIQSGLCQDIRIVPQSKKKDQINAGRKVLPHCRFAKTICEEGVDSLIAYHFKYDEENKSFSQEPEHDWSSHASDAFMYGAQMLQDFVPVKETTKSSIIVPEQTFGRFQLEELWSTIPTGHQRIT